MSVIGAGDGGGAAPRVGPRDSRDGGVLGVGGKAAEEAGDEAEAAALAEVAAVLSQRQPQLVSRKHLEL